MKVIEERKGEKIVRIETPWLSTEDVLKYLGISLTEFYALNIQRRVPHGIVGKMRRFHCEVIDKYANGDLPDEVYQDEQEDKPSRRRHAYDPAPMELKHPVTGRVFRPRKDKEAARLCAERPGRDQALGQTTAPARTSMQEGG